MEPTLGEKIKTYRKKMGLTQEELSKEAGLSKMTIRRYETDQRIPSIITASSIAFALKIPVTALIGNEENNWPEFSDKPITPRQTAEQYVNTDLMGHISRLFNELNAEGKSKDIEQVTMLTKIPEYQKESLEESK